ncbi:hypothetical protein [Acinetobacter haemolyticus]|uniref:hypothetical protein n=1 Tax=Acinetobacter haemolyticus TaxID=29430 RepID=UPI00325ABBF8
MKIQNLPMFKELVLVFCSYRIESWQTVDFWNKVKLLKVADSNVNYQSVYRLVVRLAKDGYLAIDLEKSRFGQTTYTEVEKLQDLRAQFSTESTSMLQELNLKRKEFENEIAYLKEEIDALEDLKDQFPAIKFKIDQLKEMKIYHWNYSKIKIRAINSLIDFLFT